MPRARARLAAAAALAATVALLYGPSLQFGFVTDDFYFARPLTGSQLLSTFYGNWEPYGQGNAHYRPVIAASFQLDYRMWGPRPRGYHLTNLMVMVAAGLAAFELLARLGAGRRTALLAALLWVAHPLAATAASWTSERTDSIMAVFYLAALAALVTKPFTPRTAAATVVFGLLALGSKEMAATLVPLGALLLLAAGRHRDRRRWLTLAALLALTAAYVVAWRALFPGKARLVLSDLGAKLPGLLVPVFVPVSYETAGAGGLRWPQVALVAIGLAAIGALLAWRRRRALPLRLWVLACIWPLATLPPVFGLRDPDIHRLGLLVAFGAALLAAALVEAVPPAHRRRAVLAGALVAAAALAAPSVSTSRAWGPGGFAFTSGNGWKLRDPTWESRLTPEMRRLFRRQARQHLAAP